MTATVTYYFNSYNIGEAWTTNPDNMVNGDEDRYALETVDGVVELCGGNTCNGVNLGTITKVEIRCKGYYTTTGGPPRDILLRPVFAGGDGDNHSFAAPVTTGAWSSWYDITTDTNAPSPWTWGLIDGVQRMDCDVESNLGVIGNIIYCSMIEVRVTYTPLNPLIGKPFISPDIIKKAIIR